MKKLFYILILSFSALFVRAQTEPSSTDVPAISQPYWVKYGWVNPTKGLIPVHRDTTFTPRFTGTQVFWEHAGVDSSIWTYTGALTGRKWVKGLYQIHITDVSNLQDSLDSKWRKVGANILNNNSGAVIIGSGSNQFNFSTNNFSFTNGASVQAVNFVMGSINAPFSNFALGSEAVSGSLNSARLLITSPYTNDTGTNSKKNTVNIKNLFSPTGGSAEFNALVLSGKYNQTGGANGILRGLFIHDTLTAVADYRAIEVVTGRTYLGANYFNNAALDSVLSTNAAGKVQNRLATDYITAGTNIIISGTGTAADPKVITGTGGGGGSGINTIVGTANRLQVSGTTDLTLNISPAYVGQSSITTLGTIVTGVWNGTTIAVANGGTGITAFGTGVATALGVNVGSAGAFLTFNGAGGTPSSLTLTNGAGLPLTTGVTGVLPIANGGRNSSTALSGSSIMVSNGTAIIQGAAGTSTTLLHGNASGTPTYSAVSLTADITGNLPVTNLNSGTGASSSTLWRGDGTWYDFNYLVLQYTTQTLTYGATTTMNCNSGFNGILTLTGNATLAFSNFPSKGTVMIKVIQDATGSRTLTLPANSKVPLGFGSGTSITLTTTGGAYDIVYVWNDGTNYNWTIAKNFQ